MTAEDAFRVIDKDGDSYISEKDLHDFLVSKLKFQEREVGSVRVKKLMKLMDHYKRARLSLMDWLNMIQKEADWFKEIKHQIGLVLSKLYSSLSDAFTEITQGDEKLLYGAFEKWIKAHHVLSGFVPNEDILKAIFASLDGHRKGFILENDFNALFGGYNWKSEHNREFLDFLRLKFASAEEAFKYMAQYHNKSISHDRFKKVVHEFFGNRFQKSDVEKLWQHLTTGQKALDWNRFNRLYGDLWSSESDPVDEEFPQDKWQYQDKSIIKGTTMRSSHYNYEEK